MNRIRRLTVKFRQGITLDLRALSLYRILLGSLLLIDLFIRAGDLEIFYSDNGAVTRSLVQTTHWNNFYIPLHMLAGSAGYAAALFILAGCFAFALVVGWKTRLFTFLSWLMLVSLHNRNAFILQGGDELLRNALFWSIFLPLGSFYSIDSRLKGSPRKKHFNGLAAAGYCLLIFSVYFFSALQKNSSEWLYDGTAGYYALSLDQLKLPLGKLIYPYPWLLKFITHAIWITELIAGFLLLWPRNNYRLRLTGIILLAMLHLGIGLTIYVGLFFLIGLITLVPLLPPAVMDKLEKFAGFLKLGNRNFLKPRTEAPWLCYFRQIFLGGVVIFCLLWNFSNVSWFRFTIIRPARNFAALFRFDQNWGMFAPNVFKDDGWFIYEGELNNGSKIDIRENGAQVNYNKPESIVKMFRNDRWRKYSEHLVLANEQYLRPSFCLYQLRKWNAQTNHQQVRTLRIIYMKETSGPDYLPVKPEKTILTECQ
ncbi:MAG TPA: HTTM domain-containing protein [Bacteroidia bacterium]|nr:HTTM domain-containing protein [Bacteroidia bacterium]